MYRALLTGLALAASSSAAAVEKRASGGQQVLYWGANDSEQSLATYCQSARGNDIIVMGFLSDYGNGHAPNGYIGNCLIDTKGNGASECAAIAKDIKTCQAAGKKVIVSIGGSDATPNLKSVADAQGVAYTLWNSYANPAHTSNSPRPFGDISIDGWDFDLEESGVSSLYNDLIAQLRKYAAGDTSKSYLVTGAPQCYNNGDPMTALIHKTKFDKLWIQFYNNPPCEAANYVRKVSGGDHFNFDDIYKSLQGTASAGAGLYIGLPASEEAADNAAYIRTSELPKLLNDYKTHAGYAGVMLYDAGAADVVNVNGCHYDQEVHSVLTTGHVC